MTQSVQLTRHANQRMQQRGIPEVVLDWLLQYGESQWDHHGAKVLYFTKKSRRHIDEVVGKDATRRYNEYMDSYAVVALDGVLLTCGHRSKKINRH